MKTVKLSLLREKCACCNGWLPDEGSPAWDAAEGTCPGHLIAGTGNCGAFDDSLSFDAGEQG